MRSNFEHQAVHGKRLLVEFLLVDFLNHLGERFLLGGKVALARFVFFLCCEELAFERFELFGRHGHLAREGMSTVDGGASQFKVLFGIGGTLACHVELLRERVELSACHVELFGIGAFLLFCFVDVVAAHDDLLIEGLEGEERVVALEEHFVGTHGYAFFGGGAKACFGICHVFRGFVETLEPKRLVLHALRFAFHVFVLCREQPLPFLFFG